jgi:pyruvate dehydrogenase E1 component alpha subunit
MAAATGWSKDEDQALQAECAATVDSAVQTYLATTPQSPESIFEFHFETLPQELVRQRETMFETAKTDD